MASAGLHHRKPAVKEFLTAEHKRAREAFAQRYILEMERFFYETIYTGKFFVNLSLPVNKSLSTSTVYQMIIIM